MKSCQKNRGVTWTTLELEGLLEDEDSHVHFVRTTKHLALHPYHLNNIQQSLNQILRSLKGFVLAFRNPKLLSNLGELLYDSPFIHVDIEADFYLFHPTVGSFLKGIVNKKGLDYIVMLVHKVYTVSIPKPDNTEQWLGESVEIGQEIKCCVTQIHHKSNPPFICAILKLDYSQGCRLSESITNIDNVDSAIENANTFMKININKLLENDGISEKEKKHRKKHKYRESNTEIVCKIENESELNVRSNTSKTIKSEKKQQNQSMQDDNMRNDTCITIKSEKKLQCESTSLNIDDFLNNLEVNNTPKKHKKHKKTSKSLLDNETIMDTRAESRKALKRENSILLDSITEIKQDDNMRSDTCITIKSEKKLQCPSTSLNNDDFLNNLEIDNTPKKHKKNKKTSKSLLDNETIMDARAESRKVLKRENSILLDSITEIKQDDNMRNDTCITIKSEKKLQSTSSNNDDFLNNLEVDNTPKKHKKKSKSLLDNETIMDARSESRKALKRVNPILLDNITEIKIKKEKET
ncbi:DNA-directed RNA polymerase I subunit RPA43 [Cyphomyrmex costatus]|uniref:DNA-directed RNA polymerase I subunit RPA43 n=1 Tax=Cyphomyrmex costatus TaxID=456900 RepID=A0A151IFR6_9HYME|nr:DNA-directed RNA polymerase I subunit RPA43 [Cyphomyrmex costatus]